MKDSAKQTNGDKDKDGDLNLEYEITDELGSEKCAKCQAACINCLKPILAEYNLPPTDPSLLERLHYALMCPPRGRVGAAIFVVLVGAVWWGVLWSITGDSALPGGNLFSLVLLFLLCWSGGYLINLIRLPPLLGMLIVGGVLGSAPVINIAKDIHPAWNTNARQIALTVILTRAGLGLDPTALRRLSFVLVRLAFTPILAEAIAEGIAAHLILGLPWAFALMLGFVVGGVSLAVVVPCLLSLAERGYGVDKGIPTLAIAAASLDNVMAITGFGITLGIASSSGDLVWIIFRGPVQALLGIAFGITGGIFLWYIPQIKSKNLLFFRCAMLLGGGLVVIFGSRRLQWDGIGPLGCLTLSFVAAIRWRNEPQPNHLVAIANVVGIFWMLFQPVLFGLIGAAVRINTLEAKTVGLGIAVLGIGLGVRMVVTFCAVLGTNLNLKERLFIPMTWLAKATVQAAIGAIALDWASESGTDEDKKYATQILIVAVLSILLTSPIGAALVTLLGPKLTHYTHSADRIHRETETINEGEDKTSDDKPVTSDHVDIESGPAILNPDEGEGEGKKNGPTVDKADMRPIDVETRRMDKSDGDNDADNTKRRSVTRL